MKRSSIRKSTSALGSLSRYVKWSCWKHTNRKSFNFIFLVLIFCQSNQCQSNVNASQPAYSLESLLKIKYVAMKVNHLLKKHWIFVYYNYFIQISVLDEMLDFRTKSIELDKKYYIMEMIIFELTYGKKFEGPIDTFKQTPFKVLYPYRNWFSIVMAFHRIIIQFTHFICPLLDSRKVLLSNAGLFYDIDIIIDISGSTCIPFWNKQISPIKMC